MKGNDGAQWKRSLASASETGQGVANLPKTVDEVIRMQRW